MRRFNKQSSAEQGVYTQQQLAQQLISTGQFLFAQGWSAATSSNYSVRLTADQLLITVSGKHKGELQPHDLMLIDLNGKPQDPALRPSAETALHTQLYQWSEEIHCVLHTHSITSTVLTRQLAAPQLLLRDYEMLKAFAGITTHACSVCLPIFDNTQDIASLAQQVDAYLREHPRTPAYLIRGHGVYTWGKSVAEARRHLEALEFLLRCEWQQRRTS